MCLIGFFLLLKVTVFFLLSRRWSSFVWRGCRSTNSCDRSPRVTDQSIGRGGKEGAELMQTAVPTRPRLLRMAAALTMAEAADVEATALDMVTLRWMNQYVPTTKPKGPGALTKMCGVCLCFTHLMSILSFSWPSRHQFGAVQRLRDWVRA